MAKINWDETMKMKLLLAILKTHDVKLNHGVLATELTTPEQECTASAVKQKINKMKAEFDGVAPGKGTAKSTPVKRKATGDGESSSKKRKGKGTKDFTTTAEDDSDDDELTVNSKVKKETF